MSASHAERQTVSAPAFETVVCAVDYSEHSQAALYLAAALTLHHGSRLIVVAVDERADRGEEARDHARQELEQWVSRDGLRGADGYRAGIQCVVRGGTASDSILEAAHEERADLIVLGSRGRNGLQRALFGSTTARLLRQIGRAHV